MIALLGGLFRRNAIELRRYAFDAFFQLIGVFLLFLLLFAGVKAIGGHDVQTGGTLPAIVIGFVVFSLILGTYGAIAQWMTNEATQGTLEQLAMSPFGLLRVMLAEYVAGTAVTLLFTLTMMFLAEAITGQWLRFPLLTVVPLTLILMLQVAGVGLALAGAALRFKRVASLASLIQFGFLALVSIQVHEVPWTRFLPIALANDLMREATVHGRRLDEFSTGDLATTVVVALAYLGAGVTVFTAMERSARARGVIGTY